MWFKKNTTICYLLDNPDSLAARLFRNFSISFIGTIFLIILSFVRVPILTKNLTLVDYGKIAIIVNFYRIITLLFRIRVNDLLYRFLPRFERDNDKAKVASIMRLALLICFSLCFSICIIVAFGAEWISNTIYRDASLSIPLELYLFAGAIEPLNEFSSGILRLKDRFSLLVLPQVAGTCITVLGIILLIFVFNLIELPFIIIVIAIGECFSILFSFLASMHLCWKDVIFKCSKPWWHLLQDHRLEIWSTVFYTNLISYLKLGGNEGGLFLLATLSSPGQVALFNLANRLTSPLIALQNNLQQALNPEIVKLYGKREFRKLYALIHHILKTTIVVGGLVVLFGIVLGKPIILLLTTKFYLPALPTFYVLLTTIYITFISMPFFYLSLSMDMLKQRNMAVAIRFIYLGLFCFVGLNAFYLALTQLLGAITTRILNDLPVYHRLKQLTMNKIKGVST